MTDRWQGEREIPGKKKKKKKPCVKAATVVAREAEPYGDVMCDTGYVSH